MKHLMTALYLGAAAGIAGTGITRTADPALAKKPEEKLNTTTTAKAGGNGQDGGANAQMQAAAKGVEQVGDDVNDGNTTGSASTGSSELNQSKQADAKVTGADQAT